MSQYNEKLNPSSGLTTLLYIGMAIGLLTLGAGLATDVARTFRSYLLHNLMFFGIGIGAFVFLILHYLGGAGWLGLFRRVPEAMASYIKWGILTTFVLFLGLSHLYPWTDHEMMHADHFLHHKAGYFGTAFFIIRALVFFAVLFIFSNKVLGNSLKQDTEANVELRNKQKPLSAGFIVLFAPLFTVFAVDMIKSLEPKWFSTIFGVYVFTGFVQTAIAFSIIALFFLKRANYLKFVTTEHLHDLSKYMFGFSIFWAYIAVSQYLLIWYANLPEETFYYIAREQGSWPIIGVLLIATKFALPFLLLLPRAAKRSLPYATFVAFIVIISEWIDLNWMIMPSYSPEGFVIGWQDFGFFIGFLSFFVWNLRRFLAKNIMVPKNDPYLHESEHHEVVYA